MIAEFSVFQLLRLGYDKNVNLGFFEYNFWMFVDDWFLDADMIGSADKHIENGLMTKPSAMANSIEGY